MEGTGQAGRSMLEVWGAKGVLAAGLGMGADHLALIAIRQRLDLRKPVSEVGQLQTELVYPWGWPHWWLCQVVAL